MKLIRYGNQGQEKPAAVDNNGQLRDLSSVIEDISGANLSKLPNIKHHNLNQLPLVSNTERIGACVGGVGKFICIGLNYADHAKESKLDIPAEPIIFMKATSSICGAFDNIIIPRNSKKTDWEVELGVIIGKKAKYVELAQATDYIAGYCVVNDVSEREFQLEKQGQWVKGKSCDNFGPIGPWLVTADEIPDPQNLKLTLAVNGKVMQNGNTKTMVYQIPFLISYLSQFMTLEAGDIISTGTPPGVGLGMNPPQYLKSGDLVELEIEKLGKQKQKVVSDN